MCNLPGILYIRRMMTDDFIIITAEETVVLLDHSGILKRQTEGIKFCHKHSQHICFLFCIQTLGQEVELTTLVCVGRARLC